MTTVQKAYANVLTSFLPVSKATRVWVFCDPTRAWLADGFTQAARKLGATAARVQLEPVSSSAPAPAEILLRSLSRRDAVIAAFSPGFLAGSEIARVFPAFGPPPGFGGRSAFIAPRVPDEALVAMLSDRLEAVRKRAEAVLALNGTRTLRVTAPGGTDLTLDVGEFRAVPFVADWAARVPGGAPGDGAACAIGVAEEEGPAPGAGAAAEKRTAARGDAGEAAPEPTGRHAYLPAAEVYAAIVAGSARGVIRADVTVGEFVADGEVLDPFGRAETPVELVVREGKVVGVGAPGEVGGMGGRLWSLFERFPESRRGVVELGVGLSAGPVTGQITADECLRGTCHFGLGDNRFYGGRNEATVHLDVVVRAPRFRALQAG